MGFSGRVHTIIVHRQFAGWNAGASDEPCRLVFAGVNGMLVPIMNGAHEKETEKHLWLGKAGIRLKSRGCGRNGLITIHIYYPPLYRLEQRRCS